MLYYSQSDISATLVEVVFKLIKVQRKIKFDAFLLVLY